MRDPSLRTFHNNAEMAPEDDEAFLARARPKLQILEGIRETNLGILNWRKAIAKPVAFVVTPILGFIDFWLIRIQAGSEDTLAGLSVLFLGSLWGWVTQPKRVYTKVYKKRILPEIAGLFGDFRYDIGGRVPMSEMKPSKIVPDHTDYSSEDYFTGNYKGVGIQFSEIELTKEKGDNSITVFAGLAVLLSHGTRKFYGHTILTEDHTKLGEWFQRKNTGLKRANMADPEFEGLFDVYTNDQVEARYLIDPLIIEALKNLYGQYVGDQMLVSFYNDHVLILIASKDNHFEPADIHVPATNEKELLSMKQEIAQILSLIDRLSLYDPKTRREAIGRSV